MSQPRRRSSLNTRGALIASAVASLIATGCSKHAAASARHEDAVSPVACAGINACKGKSDCSGAKNACKGANACKGQGWLQVASAEVCTKKGGKVTTGM